MYKIPTILTCTNDCQLTYFTLDELHLPYELCVGQLVIGFAHDGSCVEVQFFDGVELVGRLQWECGVSIEPITRRFARCYVSIYRQIPSYCLRDVRVLFEVICRLIEDQD